MKLPLSWLTSFVELDLGVDELTDVMSLNGLEVEAVTTPGRGVEGVHTARVVSWEPHPDAERLRVVRVTSDGSEEVELVCGAANFDVDDVVVHAAPGSRIPGMRMERREIRGVASNGMLASARELELGEDHGGILVLPPDTPLGAELAQLLPVGEPVIEIAVQPDRGDHLSVLGVARDLAAILSTSWHPPQVPSPPSGASIPVTVETEGCERFVTWRLQDVRVAPSPLWLRQRLAQCGIRSIDLVVDATNYVMLELGQPLHAFDLDRLAGPELTVRRCAGGERLTTLDGVERRLEAGDLVIDDAHHAVSLAGVMGGLDTEVSADTTRVLLEGAVWEPRAIRATSRRLGLVSEASQRFERRVDPQGAAPAVARAAGLLAELGGARPTGADEARPPSVPEWALRATVTVDTGRISRLLGLDLDHATQATLLERAGSRVTARGEDLLDVTPPSWRGDLTREADVAEEVARLHGFDAIPTTLPSLPVSGGLTPVQRLEQVARASALAGGFHEAVTRPFVGEDAFVGVLPGPGRIRLANPLAKDASSMRPSLLEGLLEALRRNRGQGRAGTALVEFGRIFRPTDDPLAGLLDEAIEGDWRWRAPNGDPLPVQPRSVALVAQGVKLGPGWLDEQETWSVFDLLAVLDEIVRRLAPPDDPTWRLTRVQIERVGLHPGRTAELTLRGHAVGMVGQLHPAEADRRDLPEPVVVAELLLEPLLARVPVEGHPPVASRPLVKHPAVVFDVALVAPEDVPYTVLEEAVRAGAGGLLDELWWFDEYRGEQLGEGVRSVAMRLRLQAPDRQLTDEDAERVIDAIAASATNVGASLRR